MVQLGGRCEVNGKELDMKKQRGIIVFLGAAWLAIAGVIGSIAAVNYAMKDNSTTDTVASTTPPAVHSATN